MQLPKKHQAVMPYLIVRNASAFVDYLKDVFDARLEFIRMREDNLYVMHAEVQMEGSTIMIADATDEWPSQTANLFVYVQDADATFEKALKLGGQEVMPLADKDYGRSGGVRDPHGNIWWVTKAPVNNG